MCFVKYVCGHVKSENNISQFRNYKVDKNNLFKLSKFRLGHTLMLTIK